AQGSERGDATAAASTNSRAEKMVEASPYRLSPYYAVPTNGRTLSAFRYRIIDLWRRSLHRRSQKDRTNWERITKLVNDFLPRVRILHPWPLARFAVRHPRWEPSARIGPARICAGSAQ